MKGQLSFLHIAVLVCAGACVVSFFASLCAMLLLMIRTGALANRAEERALSWAERQDAQIAVSAGSLSPTSSDRCAGCASASGWPRLDRSALASFCCSSPSGADECSSV